MKLPVRNEKNKTTLMLAFAIPFVGMLIVMLFSGYKPFGKYSMLYSDMYHQYYPFFAAFRRTLRRGESLLYSWGVGMGVDYLGLIAYYLASPLNLLGVIVPDALVLHYFSLLVPIKLGLAGIFFAIFLQKLFGKTDIAAALFGGLYGLCAWALGYQWNVMWLDTFALLPLVILGTISLIREKKIILYTFTLFLSVFANYYIGFFTCIFVALVFFSYEICRFPGWKRFGGDLLRIAVFSALAIGMTAILTIPAFQALQTTQSSVNQFPTGFKLNIAKENTIMGLLGAMRSVAGNMGGGMEPTFKEGLPNLYCGVGTILLGFLYLIDEKKKWKEKLCFLFLLLFFNLSFIIRQLDYIWHGFHFTNMIPYRFSFLYSFVLLVMAYRAWLSRKHYDCLQVLSAVFLTAAVLCCSDQLTSTVSAKILSISLQIPVYILYNGLFLMLYSCVLFYNAWQGKPSQVEEEEKLRQKAIRSRRWLSKIWLLSIISMELAAMLIAFGIYFPGTSVTNYPRGTEEAASMIRYMHEREQRTLFYRAETTHSQTLNDGALNDYNGISTFTSSANVRITEFMRSLGYGAKNTYNRYCFEESSPVANLFLDLKYMLEREGRDRTSSVFSEVHHFGKVRLLKNEVYLPLGFVAENALAEYDFFNETNAFKQQNGLFTAATGIRQDVWHRVKGKNLSITGNGVTISDENTMGYCTYSDCAAGAELTYTYIADQDGFACIHLNLPKRNDFHVLVNEVELYRENISLPQMLAVQDVHVGDTIQIRINCASNESGAMTVMCAILNNDLFRQGYEILSQSVWELTSFKETFVEGIVRSNRDGLLYTSIPENGNWKVTLDGKPTETKLVGDCMIGIPITAGNHMISFRYHNSAFSLGWKISAVSFLMMLLLCWKYYLPELSWTTKGKYQK